MFKQYSTDHLWRSVYASNLTSIARKYNTIRDYPIINAQSNNNMLLNHLKFRQIYIYISNTFV